MRARPKNPDDGLHRIAVLLCTNGVQVAVAERIFPLSTSPVDKSVNDAVAAAKLPEKEGPRWTLAKKVPNPSILSISIAYP